LIGLNIIYIFVAFLLIGVAAAAKNADYIRSVSTVGGIVACGVFLLFIAIVGLYGTVKHHQILLFVYMVVLFSIFVIQFSVACACLAASTEDELNLTERAWNKSPLDEIQNVEEKLNCCGFNKVNVTECLADCVSESENACLACKVVMTEKIDYAFNSAGGVGLFFAFTEIIGAVLAYRFRNLQDPGKAQASANPLYAPQYS